MNKIKILVTYPFIEQYQGKELMRHLRDVTILSKGKNTAFIYFNPEQNFEDLLRFKDDDMVEDMVAGLCDFNQDRNYENTYGYWDEVAKAVMSVGHYTEINLMDGMLQIYDLEARAGLCFGNNCVERNYLQAKAQFLKLFGDTKSIYNEIKNDRVDLVITDLFTASGLYDNYSDEFDFIKAYPRNADMNLALDSAMTRRLEYKIFNKWDFDFNFPNEPSLIGNWGCGYGEFTLYCLPEVSYGDTSGIISDRYGLARFNGVLDKKYFTFSKYYFSEVVKKSIEEYGEKRGVNDLPIEYNINLVSRVGKYSCSSRDEDGYIYKLPERNCIGNLVNPPVKK